MKKALLALAAVAALFASCAKPAANDPSQEAAINYTGATEISVAKDGEIFMVKFSANVDWKAALSCKDDIAKINRNAGAAGDTAGVKVTVFPFNEENDREFTLTLTAEGAKPVVITFCQTGLPYINVFESEFDENGYLVMAKEGGESTMKIKANTGYTVNVDEECTWLHVTPANDSTSYKIAVDAYDGISERSCFIYIVSDELIDKDEESGEPTNRVLSYCVIQSGKASIVWAVNFPEEVPEAYTTMAIRHYNDTFGIVVNCEYLGMAGFNPDGSFEGFDDKVKTFQSLTNDSAGNIVALAGNAYEAPFSVISLAPGADIETGAKLIKEGVNDIYGYGLCNIRAKGDTQGDNYTVSMFSAGGYENGSYYWVFDKDNQYRGTTHSPAAIWGSQRGVVSPAGSKISDGLYYIAYCDDYNVYNCADPTAETPSWEMVYETPSSWMEGYSALEAFSWNGKEYIAFIEECLFDYDCPGIVLVDVTDKKNATLVASFDFGLDYEHYASSQDNLFISASGSDVIPVVEEDGNLVLFVMDAGSRTLACIRIEK